VLLNSVDPITALFERLLLILAHLVCTQEPEINERDRISQGAELPRPCKAIAHLVAAIARQRPTVAKVAVRLRDGGGDSDVIVLAAVWL
jgi:hypothetical protein